MSQNPGSAAANAAALRTPWSSKLVLKTACACALRGEPGKALGQFRQLGLGIFVLEASRRGVRGPVPGGRVAAMQPQQRQLWMRACPDGGHAVLRPGGRVDHRVHRAQITQQGQRAGRRGGAVEPAAVAQLDGDQMLVHAPRRLGQRRVARARRRRIQGGNWKCTAPSLPGRRSGSSASV